MNYIMTFDLQGNISAAMIIILLGMCFSRAPLLDHGGHGGPAIMIITLGSDPISLRRISPAISPQWTAALATSWTFEIQWRRSELTSQYNFRFGQQPKAAMAIWPVERPPNNSIVSSWHRTGSNALRISVKTSSWNHFPNLMPLFNDAMFMLRCSDETIYPQVLEPKLNINAHQHDKVNQSSPSIHNHTLQFLQSGTMDILYMCQSKSITKDRTWCTNKITERLHNVRITCKWNPNIQG